MTNVSTPTPARFDDPLTLIFRAKTRLYSLWLRSTYPFAEVGRNLSVHPGCAISRRRAHQIRLGNSILIRKDAWLNVPYEAGQDEKLVIEDNCVIGIRSVISAKNHIHIERDVITAGAVLIQDHNHAYENVDIAIRDQGVTTGGRIRIEQGCWIGQGVAIVCNQGKLVIGRNSVIGANSVVTRSVPPYSVVVGNPGRVGKQYDPAKKAWVRGSGRQVEPTVG